MKIIYVLTKTLIFCIPISLLGQFISIQNKQFFINGLRFIPMVMNYTVNIRYEGSENFWVSPSMSYYTTPVGSNCKTKEDCFQDLLRDFNQIHRLGFNTVRIVDLEFGVKDMEYSKDEAGTIDISYYYGPLKFHPFVPPFEDHFKLIDQILKAASQTKLKVILLSGGKQIEKFPLSESYKIYLEYLARRYQNEPNLIAYDLINEPSYFHKGPDKKETQLLVQKWSNAIRENTSHQLITIGFGESHTIFDWDPMMLDLDFYSFHIYPGPDGKMDNFLNQVYWISKVSDKPWIIGETAYPATTLNVQKGNNGSIEKQTKFFEESYKFCLDCGGQGYSWWQYHDVSWSPDYGLLDSFHMLKPFGNLVKDFHNYTPNFQNCRAPQNYWNMLSKFKNFYAGKIVDEQSHPISNALIIASTFSGKPNYTYSLEDGTFTVYCSGTISKIKISAPGYKIRKRNAFLSSTTTKLQKEIFDNKSFINKNQKDILNYCKFLAEKEWKQCKLTCNGDKDCLSKCSATLKLSEFECKNKMSVKNP